MDDFYKRIQHKRIEEVNLEKKYLEDLNSKFNIEKELLKKEEEMIQNKIIENESKLDNNKPPDLEETNRNIQENNEKKELNVKENEKYVENFKLGMEKIEKEIIIIKKNYEILDDEREKYLILLETKNKKVEIYKKKKDKKENEMFKLSNLINLKEKEIKDTKSSLNKEIFKSVLDRQNLLQENINNLIYKKQIAKENKELKEKIKEKEDNHLKLVSERKELRSKKNEEYLNQINEENILDKINNKKNFFEEFDKETEKLIFFSTNSINVMKKNLKNLNKRYDFKQNMKIKNIKSKNKIFDKKINFIIQEKSVMENDKKNLENDVKYLDGILYELSNKNQLFKNEQDKFFEDKLTTLKNNEQKKNKIIHENKIKLEIYSTKMNENLKKLDDNIENIKKKYVKDKHRYEFIKNKIKLENTKLNNEIDKVKKDFFIKENKYLKKKSEIEERLKYLGEMLRK